MLTTQNKIIEDLDLLAQEKLEVFKSDLRPDGTFKTKNFSTIRSLSEHIATDYGDRYLLELVQNAYDALEEDNNSGLIRIVFAPDEGEWGTLYIGNGGKPFTWQNVEAICLIGQSDKPAGENIGNKGLGFRSVSYISDHPAIYSLSPESKEPKEFGYCFRFAEGNDFLHWTDDASLLEKLPENLPPFCIPFPLTSTPDIVDNFISEGFVTVIALPVRDKEAKDSVFQQLDLLENGAAPLLLFLDRICRLEIVIPGHPDLSYTLIRQNQEIDIPVKQQHACRLSLVTLDKSEKYLISWGSIPEQDVRETILKSIKKKQLHYSWENWKGNGELALALSLSEPIQHGILYTFLPMGESAHSPFQGHLHGSFYPKSDRTSLHGDSALNAMYIKAAIRLSAVTVQAVKEIADSGCTSFAYKDGASVIADLLSWHEVSSIKGFSTQEYADQLKEQFTDSNSSFNEVSFLPVQNGEQDEAWAAPRSAWEWNNDNLGFITAEQITRAASVPVLSSVLSPSQKQRMISFLQYCLGDDVLQPDIASVAQALERIALRMGNSESDIGRWTVFYNDLLYLSKNVFASRLKNGLQEKKILFCSGSKVQKGGYSAAPKQKKRGKRHKKSRRKKNRQVGTIVFSPSQRAMKKASGDAELENLLKVPRTLANGFAFLSRRLDWYGELDEVRQFFEKHKFVNKYDARELITNVARIQRESKNSDARYQALDWLFQLYRDRGVNFEGAFAEADILVPVGRSQWARAKDSYFSAKWSSSKLHSLLEDFFDRAAKHSNEIGKLKKNLLRQPGRKPFRSTEISAWYNFLILIGVNSGLKPLTIRSNAVRSITNPTIQELCSRLKLKEHTSELMITDAGGERYYSEHKLTARTTIYYWPGQEDFSDFSSDVKKMYASLLLDWIGKTTIDLQDLELEYYHYHFSQAQRFKWPSPLLAFLRQEKWFPVEIMQGVNSGEHFAKLSDTWLPEEETSRNRPFMPLIPSNFGIRNKLSHENVYERLYDWGGCHILGDNRESTDQVAMLGHIFGNQQVDDYASSEFINLYRETWKKIAIAKIETWPDQKQPDWLVIRQNGNFLPCASSQNAKEHEYEGPSWDKVYFSDTEDPLPALLLEDLGNPVFCFESNNPVISGLLKQLSGVEFVGTSNVEVSVLVDRQPFEESTNNSEIFLEKIPSFSALLCLAMESLSGTAARKLPADRGELLARLRRIKLITVGQIGFTIDDEYLPLPESNYGIFGHAYENTPYIILEQDGKNVTWDYIRQSCHVISKLLDQQDIANALNIACTAMERFSDEVSIQFNRNSHLAAVCRALSLSTADAEKALAIETGDKQRISNLLYPLVYYFVDDQAAANFQKICEKSQTVDELLHRVKRLFEDCLTPFEKIDQAVKSSNRFDFLLDELELDLAKFNKCLQKAELEPITFPDLHKRSMQEFLEENRDRFVSRLQDQFLDTFKDRGDLTPYISLRDEMMQLPPDNDWLTIHRELSEELLNDRVNSWMLSKGMQPVSHKQYSLEPWSLVTKKNERFIKKFIEQHGKIIKAWCLKNSNSRYGLNA